MRKIRMRGVRTHNLKNVNVDIPRDQMVVITGLSGSGKSSLAFDTLYAEGQRRYVESLSAYARQFLSMMSKPDLDVIEGLSPAIAIEQKATSHNPRSTVGTITEIYDYLRLLYARVGQPRCPTHHHPLAAQTISQMVDAVMALPNDTAIMVLSPKVRERKGEYQQLLHTLAREGYVRARIDDELVALDPTPTLDLRKKHNIDVVVDRLKVREGMTQRLAESLETATTLSDGLVYIAFMKEKKPDMVFSARYACPDCGYSVEALEPRLFSFNNPKGACSYCDGLGVRQDFDPDKIVSNPALSLAQGAVRGWDRRHFYYYHLLLSLAKHYRFDIDLPFESLPKRIQHIILYGSGDEAIELVYHSPRGKPVTRHQPFEGVIPNFSRRYLSSDSSAVRDELAQFLTAKPCEDCGGSRLCQAARHVYLEEHNLPTITRWSIEKTHAFFEGLRLEGKRGEIAERILKEVRERLRFLIDVGLNYLSLDRSAETLSGGEAQRIRLASQIGSGLVGVMYILDEPTIGLHQRDNTRLLKSLIALRELGNTVIMVEHDEEAICTADYIIDMGPGAGIHGGEVVASGTATQIMKQKQSLTGQYLSGKQSIPLPKRRISAACRPQLTVTGATRNNLKQVTVQIPLGLMTCVTGVSGSGKSSLINDTVYPYLAHQLNGAALHQSLDCESISGLDELDKVVDIDQAPIGRTPRSNPATYTGLLTPIRELFASTPEARARGYKPGRFSFNVRGGRCEACEGDGVIKVEMHFLADIYVTCDVCQGKRYNRETLDIKYKGKTIHDVLEMSVEAAREFFDAIPVVARKCQTLIDVGLSYIALGQRATTLSGGEAQRIKLAKELSRRDTGRTFYILDEPTTGLHFHDVKQLLSVLMRLRDRGNTIVVIEHNMDVIKVADWIIDLGPEGGDHGGTVVVTGTPEAVAKQVHSHTGRYLKKYLEKYSG